jgi:hypothetical protein
MLNYTDLSPAKQKYIDLVELFFPDIKTRGVITFQEMNDIHAFFVKKREENKKYKCSMPIWLITSNAMSRGVYKFPASDVTIEQDTSGLTELDLQYHAELARYGIKVPV